MVRHMYSCGHQSIPALARPQGPRLLSARLGGTPHLTPVFETSQAATAGTSCQGPVCQPIFGMQVFAVGTGLWRGIGSEGGRCVSEEALLLCHAHLGEENN